MFFSGGSKWASPIILLQKVNQDLRTCGDIKIGVNHKICSDSFTIPNIKTAIHKLSGMKFFANIYLKSAHNQIQTDKLINDKEINAKAPLHMNY